MTSHVGLDVAGQETQICILGASGAVRWAGKARSGPTALAAVLRQRAPGRPWRAAPSRAGCAAG